MDTLSTLQRFAKQGKSKIKPRTNKAVYYTRVSTKDQADNNTSLFTQKKFCEEFAHRNKLEIVEHFGGTHESAKNDDRKEFNKMLKFVRKGNAGISHIIVYSFDRFSRSGANGLKLIQDLKDEGISVLSVTQNVDASTPSGSLQQSIQMVFSEYDNNQRKLKCMAGSKERLKQGYWVSMAPYGYDQATINGEQRITVNKIGEKLRKAFLMKASQGLSNVEIVEQLRQMGLKDMYKQKLTKIFANPFYCGYISHAMLEGEVVKGRHEKLVSEAVFMKVNNLQAQNRHGYKKLEYDEMLPLKRFVKCEQCNTVLTGYEVKAKGIHYYKCPTTGCKSNINAGKLHEQFQDHLKPLQVEAKYLAPLKVMLQITFEQLAEQKQEEQKDYKETAKVIQKKLDAIEERFAIGEIGPDIYEKFSTKFKEELKEIEKQNLAPALESSNLEKYLDFALEISTNLCKSWELGNFQHRQKLQQLVYPDGLHFSIQNKALRTIRMNSILSLITSLSGACKDKKKGLTSKKTCKSLLAEREGFEPPDL